MDDAALRFLAHEAARTERYFLVAQGYAFDLMTGFPGSARERVSQDFGIAALSRGWWK